MGKRIEPTEAMVESVALGHKLMRMDDRSILRTALNHPDAAELLAAKWKSNAEAAAERAERAEEKLAEAVRADEDDRPWEPLSKGDPLNVGDEVRRERAGITITAVVGRVDKGGDPWTAGEDLIGMRRSGTWYVRRTVQELPTEDGAVIVPAEGREFIEAVVNGHTYYAREAMLINGLWRAVWRTPHCFQVSYSVLPWKIPPGTWKVADQ